jgi:predicted metal-binding membrane protein
VARPYVPTAVFLAGYLLVWTGFSLIAAFARWVLHSTALLSDRMVATSGIFGGSILIAAGVFQWTPLKRVCLTRCQSPLAFFTTSWREGARGALWMGTQHGLNCTGCCWVLMALLFVAGVMNLWWIGAITLLVIIEKVAPRGLWLGRIAGAGFILWGIGLLTR